MQSTAAKHNKLIMSASSVCTGEDHNHHTGIDNACAFLTIKFPKKKQGIHRAFRRLFYVMMKSMFENGPAVNLLRASIWLQTNVHIASHSCDSTCAPALDRVARRDLLIPLVY
jgi:hypothetical protein